MIGHATMYKVIGTILARAERSSFVPLVGLAAFFSTLSMSVPVEWLVVVASLARRCLLDHDGIIAAVGSTVAGILSCLSSSRLEHLG